MLKYLWIFVLYLSTVSIYAQSEVVNLISWNIRDFGKTKDSRELEQIANIVKDADIIAIQEVVAGYGGAQAVAKLSAILNRKGAKWDYMISNPTKSSKYLTERYAFIWKTKHIKIKTRGLLLTELEQDIDREPFMADFYINGRRFTILNFHSLPYSKNPRPEIKMLLNHIINNIKTPVILAGDFNINEQDSTFDNFIKHGHKPSVFNKKTTLKTKCSNGKYLNYSIDNIYYSKTILKLKSKVIDFVLVCDNLKEARFLSDHLPVFLRFRIN